MAKTIYQLAKLARRIPRRLRGVIHELAALESSTLAEELKASRRHLLQKQAARHQSAARALGYNLRARRVNALAVRCALPLKKQRAAGLIPAVS